MMIVVALITIGTICVVAFVLTTAELYIEKVLDYFDPFYRHIRRVKRTLSSSERK
jgi:hypothetical protein